jgi:hypothetical protein
MNLKRILLGGLLAGVVINVSEGILNAVILMDDYQALMDAHGLVETSWAVVGYLASGFVFGFAVAWLYAAIRPRFGPGWSTGARAGVLLWVAGYAVPTIWFGAVGLTLAAGATMLVLIWGLVELILAGGIAGWLYQEEGEATVL